MENVNIHEFIWTNTNTEITGQGYYIGAEIVHDCILNFYLVIPSKGICEFIRNYLIPNTLFPNDKLPTYPIDERWFNYTSTPDKDRISVLPPMLFKSLEVSTRQFAIDAGAITKVKFLEITVPKVFESPAIPLDK